MLQQILDFVGKWDQCEVDLGHRMVSAVLDELNVEVATHGDGIYTVLINSGFGFSNNDFVEFMVKFFGAIYSNE